MEVPTVIITGGGAPGGSNNNNITNNRRDLLGPTLAEEHRMQDLRSDARDTRDDQLQWEHRQLDRQIDECNRRLTKAQFRLDDFETRNPNTDVEDSPLYRELIDRYYEAGKDAVTTKDKLDAGVDELKKRNPNSN